MSLEDQERALVDLVFDDALRRAFESDPHKALLRYELTDEERLDLEQIDKRGLAVDVRDRARILLGRFVRAAPMSVALVCRARGGVDVVRGLYSTLLVRGPHEERTERFLRSFEMRARNLPLSEAESDLLDALLSYERSLAALAARRRARALQDRAVDEVPRLPPSWKTLPLSLAADLLVCTLPASTQVLHEVLLPTSPESLWEHLDEHGGPTSALPPIDPHLCLARARAEIATSTEAVVVHDTADLPMGFLPLLKNLDGARSADDLLEGMQRAAAPASVLHSVEAGLTTLVERGFLVVTR